MVRDFVVSYNVKDTKSIDLNAGRKAQNTHVLTPDTTAHPFDVDRNILETIFFFL
jgi:hypothetical protein